MPITKQQIVDKYNEIYAAGNNNINKLFTELTQEEKFEALLLINSDGITNNSANTLFVPFERLAGSFNNNTEYHDCCEFLTNAAGQQNFTPVTTSNLLEIISTSVNDTALGSGSRTIGILYLNAIGEWSQTIVTLNGTTPVPVNIQASSIIAMYVLTGGTSLTSLGNITLRNTSNTSVIYEQIVAGGNRSQSGRITIPNGYYAKLTSLIVSCQNQNVEFKLRTTRNPFDGSNTGDRYLFCYNFKLTAGSNLTLNVPNIIFEAGHKIKVSAITDATANNPRIHGSFTLDLYKI